MSFVAFALRLENNLDLGPVTRCTQKKISRIKRLESSYVYNKKKEISRVLNSNSTIVNKRNRYFLKYRDELNIIKRLLNVMPDMALYHERRSVRYLYYHTIPTFLERLDRPKDRSNLLKIHNFYGHLLNLRRRALNKDTKEIPLYPKRHKNEIHSYPDCVRTRAKL